MCNILDRTRLEFWLGRLAGPTLRNICSIQTLQQTHVRRKNGCQNCKRILKLPIFVRLVCVKNKFENAIANSSLAVAKLLLRADIRWPPGSYPSRICLFMSSHLATFSFDENVLKNSIAFWSSASSMRVCLHNVSIMSMSWRSRTERNIRKNKSLSKPTIDFQTCAANRMQNIAGVTVAGTADGEQVGHKKLHAGTIIDTLSKLLLQSQWKRNCGSKSKNTVGCNCGVGTQNRLEQIQECGSDCIPIE